MNTETKFKLRSRIIDPSIATPALTASANGRTVINLYAATSSDDSYGNIVYGTNRLFEIPIGHVGLVFPMENCSTKDLVFANSFEMICSTQCEEVKLRYKKFNSDRIYTCSGDDSYTTESYGIGDLVGQLLIMPAPQIEIEEIN